MDYNNLVYSCIKLIPFLTQEIRMAGPYALAGRDRPGQCCGRAAIDDTLKVSFYSEYSARTSWESSSVCRTRYSLPQQDIHTAVSRFHSEPARSRKNSRGQLSQNFHSNVQARGCFHLLPHYASSAAITQIHSPPTAISLMYTQL